MANETKTPPFSGSSTVLPGSTAGSGIGYGSGTLHSDDIQSGVMRGANDATDRISAEAAAIGTELEQGARRTAERLRSEARLAADRAELASRRLLETSRSNVRTRPLTWIGLAVVAGAIIARLVR